MRLEKLTLKNFKGCRSFTLNAQGDDLSVYGDNGTYKTTLCDGLAWLLFDTDSQFKKQFEIKTLDATGEAKHGLDHEVEGSFLLDSDKTITLRKSYKEKWPKKRGKAATTFTGHTTDHFVDGVPKNKTEFKKTVDMIAIEDIFRLLTSPLYFSSVLKWQDRRELLMEVCGDVSDKEVLASSKDLSGLGTILAGRKLDDHKKVVDVRRREINKELDKIPIRIDEVTAGMADVGNLDAGKLAMDVDRLNGEIGDLETNKAGLNTGGGIAEKIKELAQVEGELQRLKNAALVGDGDVLRDWRQSLANLEDEARRIRIAAQESKDDDNMLASQMVGLSAVVTKRREDWHDADALKFEGSDTCQFCMQLLPEEKLVTAISDFNEGKAEKIKEIQAEGKRINEKLLAMGEEKKVAEQGVVDVLKILEEKEKEIATLDLEIQSIANSPDQNVTPEIEAAGHKIITIEAEIAELKEGGNHALAVITDKISFAKEKKRETEKSLLLIDNNKKAVARTEELMAEAKILAAEYEKLERELFLMEEFTRAKVDMLEGKINSKFKMSRFKLFSEQVNGGLSECCEVTCDGVPFSGGLNNGARINVGLDIISTLAAHYGQSMPVFVDNAESIVELLPVDTQVIKLIVSPGDKKLRVESIKKEKVA